MKIAAGIYVAGMSSALVGFLVVFCVCHMLLVMAPITNTLQSPISRNSKIFWCLFLIFLPVVGVCVFHFRYRASRFSGKAYERSAAEERAASGTLAPRDDD